MSLVEEVEAHVLVGLLLLLLLGSLGSRGRRVATSSSGGGGSGESLGVGKVLLDLYCQQLLATRDSDGCLFRV